MKEDGVVFNLKRENDRLRVEVEKLIVKTVGLQEVIDKLTDRLFDRARQLVGMTELLLDKTTRKDETQ